jgi:hypothetical protein
LSGKTAFSALPDIFVVDAVALDVATVKMARRDHALNMRTWVLQLLNDCGAEAAGPEMFELLGALVSHADKSGRDQGRCKQGCFELGLQDGTAGPGCGAP